MEEKNIFRTAVFGGYQKEDVAGYIRSLENENETIRILAKKEKSDLKIQLEKEKAMNEELKTTLSALYERIAALEKEEKKPEASGQTAAPPQNSSHLQPDLKQELQQLLKQELNQEEQQRLLIRLQQELEELRRSWEELQKLPQAEAQEKQEKPPAQEPVEEEMKEAIPPQPEADAEEESCRKETAASDVAPFSQAASEQPPARNPERKPEKEAGGASSQKAASQETPVPEYGKKTRRSLAQMQRRAAELLLELDKP